MAIFRSLYEPIFHRLRVPVNVAALDADVSAGDHPHFVKQELV